MRTTIHVDDQLLIQAKAQAATLRVTVARLIEDALGASLMRRANVEHCGRVRLITMQGTGTRPGIDLDHRHSLLEIMEGRDKGIVVESTAYVLTCMRSIELNPVRAGLVARPADDRWSSDPANALGEDNRIICLHDESVHLGQTLPQRWEAYRALCNTHLAEAAGQPIRDATNGV